jgi:hypothetical protein
VATSEPTITDTSRVIVNLEDVGDLHITATEMAKEEEVGILTGMDVSGGFVTKTHGL